MNSFRTAPRLIICEYLLSAEFFYSNFPANIKNGAKSGEIKL